MRKYNTQFVLLSNFPFSLRKKRISICRLGVRGGERIVGEMVRNRTFQDAHGRVGIQTQSPQNYLNLREEPYDHSVKSYQVNSKLIWTGLTK